ncbi:DUF1624 domain-containing protein [Paraliomyxa miuraensis]|uniref:DUF1624 domain-containing protein n=1 Tax=Paraliomyxa miuraensis TaxID=376150 RepID=UPI00225953ED|nr:heparan-alpha-glucosaminide N-acetyltransferase domain-containing protein [Paraliomyxa miuraensis]MCX4247520.1 heparan-alpha-glucosaminide N-acetyltransferase domain-containing protein [Paraliomyxa miuraensis]
MPQPAPTAPDRLRALDWLRGIVMIVMAIDHASIIYNAGRIANDNAIMHVVGTPLPPGQFFTRWITHLCAPAFVLLAGAGIALAGARRQGRDDARAFDRHLLVRGLVLVGLDLFYMSALVGLPMLQVLYAIGIGMIALIPARRLGPRTLLVLALGWLTIDQAVTSLVWDPAVGSSPALAALAVGYFQGEQGTIIYPALPWLAIMLLGHALGQHIARWQAGTTRTSPVRVLVLAGLAGLCVFAVVRAANGYGNMFLLREDGSLTQWLHVSKYPPALAFVGLELGLVALILAMLMKLEPRMPSRPNGPVLVLGQTALFFYLIHWLVLGIPATIFGLFGMGGPQTACLAAAAAVLVLLPVCRWYRGYKRAHPTSWVRYV